MRILRRIVLLVFAMAIAAGCASKTLDIGVGEDEALLFKVEKEGAPVSYLLGTMHMGNSAELPADVSAAMQQTDILMLESNLNPTMMDLVALMPLMTGSSPLREKIGSDMFASLTAHVAETVQSAGKSNMPGEDYVNKLRPWAALSFVLYAVPDNYSMFLSVDYVLNYYAEEFQMRTVSLETVAETNSYFYNLPEERATELLKYSIEHYEENAAIAQKMAVYYKERKIKEFVALALSDTSVSVGNPESDKFWEGWTNDIINKRNDNWMPKIEAQLHADSTLIAVGALHLYGKKGLISRLRNKGYTVTAVLCGTAACE